MIMNFRAHYLEEYVCECATFYTYESKFYDKNTKSHFLISFLEAMYFLLRTKHITPRLEISTYLCCVRAGIA
jgi:hypothetical protein